MIIRQLVGLTAVLMLMWGGMLLDEHPFVAFPIIMSGSLLVAQLI